MVAPICATCWSRSISTRSKISPATASFKPRTPTWRRLRRCFSAVETSASRRGPTWPLAHRDCAMKHRLVLYKVKPEAVAENRRLIEAVFQKLPARAPGGVRYMGWEVGGGDLVPMTYKASQSAL